MADKIQSLQEVREMYEKQRIEREKREMESMPELVQKADIHHPRYSHTKERRAPGLIKLCDEALKRYPGFTYVFLERDAIPAFIIMQALADNDPQINATSFALTRDMMPRNLWERIENIDRNPYLAAYDYCVDTEECSILKQETEKLFHAGQDEITFYVRQNRNDGSLLHRYIEQELGQHENMLFVDTGFWGKCTAYLQAFFEEKNSDYLLLFGPPGSSHIATRLDEEFATQFVEMIDHGFEIQGLKPGKPISLETYKGWKPEIHQADYLAIEVAALEHAHQGKVPDEKIKQVLDKYNIELKE